MSVHEKRPSARSLGALIWVTLAVIVYILAPLRTLETHGPGLILLHVVDLVAAILVVAVCAAAGDRALKHLRVSFPSSLARLPFAIALGAGILGTATLVGSALLGVRGWSLGLVLFGTAVALGGEL